MSEDSNSSSRWWEIYALRYAMGTLVGALVFYFLCSANTKWWPLLLHPEPNPSPNLSTITLIPLQLDKLQLLLLVAYGLVYCYIASAPILVFHATRFLLDYKVREGLWVRWFPRYLLFPLIVVVYIWWASGRLLWIVVGFIFAFILGAQYCLGFSALFKREQLYVFYARLSKRRGEAKGDILDSYRHLREHGNSFFIVLLEVVLGFVLFGAGRYQLHTTLSSEKASLLYLAILFVWILPSVGVWFIATSFEREFSKAPLEGNA